jgi:hypothetical protein
MSATLTLIGERNGNRVYRIGSLGLDGGNQDTDGNTYTALLRTDRFSPLGEGGLALFRRVSVRVLRSGAYTITARVYVDDTQTQRYENVDTGSSLVDQVIVLTNTASALVEDVLQIDVSAQGTHISVELTIDSDDLTGVFLVESMEVHLYPVRPARGRAAESQ